MESGESKRDKKVCIDPNIDLLRDNDFAVIQADHFARNESELTAALKDTRRCWYVVVAGFLIQVLILGVLHVFGVFFVALIEEFKCSKADAGMKFTFNIRILQLILIIINLS